MSAREEILGRVRSALADVTDPDVTETPVHWTYGATVDTGDLGLVDRFAERVADYRAVDPRFPDWPTILDTAYERRSIILTSNTHPSGFDSIMPKTLATAGVDRLMHHAHLIVTTGESFRFTEAKNGGGVTPLIS